MTALGKGIDKYNCRCFNISKFHVDNEFDEAALKQYLEPALVHIYGREEHVGPID